MNGHARSRSAVSNVPRHEVAALQPAAREQEPRGRRPVERTARAGWQVNTISSCVVGGQRMIKNSKDHLRAGTLMRRVTSTPLLSNQCRPSISQPTVDEFVMPAETSIALSRAHLHADMHVASYWRPAHNRDRRQH